MRSFKVEVWTTPASRVQSVCRWPLTFFSQTCFRTLESLNDKIYIWTKFKWVLKTGASGTLSSECNFSFSTVLQFISVSSSNCENSPTSSSSPSGLHCVFESGEASLLLPSTQFASVWNFWLFSFYFLLCESNVVIRISSNLDHNMPNYKSNHLDIFT